ncbi:MULTISPECIES: zinc-dependent alcohol dehydrogenase [Streptomyces]|uniref:2-deoxy-scyllo-inosamine dehydrogenase n=1 Tax=Streptomyces chartreusis NRRL 3882 TaxID=1079985 RepID=A0A2N9BKF6_STRCX|nr:MULTISPECIES: zinc-binding dehydrogenase [Streptomyces]MYS94248.1 zinc-binding dehydrogenase [Streptomyces sp. SID5464]SOR83844.1 D-arabitol-phosphate dehydrogenase [Streptomyces chartreusis NRRL 3882]
MSLPKTMQAAVLGEPGTLAVTTLPVPRVGPEDVLVQVRRASLCGTDLKIRSRHFFKDGGPPAGEFVPGHEYAGVVAAVGSAVDELRVGDRVVTEAHRGCTRCANCLAGAYTDCLNYGLRHTGHRAQGMTVNGGFAQYALNHVATLHRLPDTVDFDEAVVLSTVGTVMHAFDVLDTLLVGSTVAVVGPGPIGLLAAQVARELGATVALVGTREARLAIGKSFGADLVVNSREQDAVAAVREATDGIGADIVLECSGAPSAVDDALRMAKRSGKVVLVGFFEQPVQADLNHAVMNGISIQTVRGEGTGSLARAVALAARGRLRTAELVTHHFALSDVSEAFDTYAERRGNAIKVMLDISEDPESIRAR